MGNALFVIGAIVLAVVGAGLFALRSREPKKSDGDGIAAFQREMRALSPKTRRVRGDDRGYAPGYEPKRRPGE